MADRRHPRDDYEERQTRKDRPGNPVADSEENWVVVHIAP